MSPIVIGITGLVALFLLMLMGMPIGLAMALVGFVGYALVSGTSSAVVTVGLVPWSTVASYIFSVLPLFLLMSEFSSSSGIMRDTYRTAYKWLGHLPGGMAMATIGGCAGFAAVCGSSVASAATVTRICLPEMLRYKYDPRLATGSIAVGGTLGILIPPSMSFIIYGLIADQSVGKLFIAGVFPGILLTFMLMLTIYIIAKLNPWMGPAAARANWRQRLASFKDLWGMIVLFLLVMGGIWGGIFTPTEAGGVGAFVAFLFLIGRRQLTRQNLSEAFWGTFRTTGMIFVIIIGAMIFSYFVTVANIPRELANFIVALPIPSVGILVAILFIYLILGCVMDAAAMVLITVPIFLPVLLALGIDLLWFGVLLTVMTELGLITPPIGMNVFVIAGMSDIPMYTIFRGIIPFVVTLIVFMAILVAFPQISLFLPNTMMAMK